MQESLFNQSLQSLDPEIAQVLDQESAASVPRWK